MPEPDNVLMLAVGAGALLLLGCADDRPTASVAPEYAELAGTVTATAEGLLPIVHAYNTEKNIGYTVFVVDGRYHAVNLIPGPYDVTVRPLLSLPVE